MEIYDVMIRGGSYPATSDVRDTPMGALAIERFLYPVCYQSYPDAWLPEMLKDDNPLGIVRLMDGIATQATVT